MAGTNPARSKAALSLTAMVTALAGLCFADSVPAPAHSPRFSDYPFDQWAAASDHSAIRWDVHLLPTQLSVHQRLIERVQAIVPGGELEKRRGRGELVLLARFDDCDGRQFRAASRLNLIGVQAGAKSDELTFTIAAFVKPGDYRILIALVDTFTMEHSFTRRSLHVAPLKQDPLPQAWLALPSVEVLPAVEAPDAWFLPGVKGLLQLPIGPDGRSGEDTAYAKHPAQIDLLVNMTPSERSASSAASVRRTMSAVIPALKVLSGLNAKRQAPSAAVIDLVRHRVGFETSDAATLDWSALGKVLTEHSPGIIDAKSLATQSSMRDYFSREVERRVGESGPPRWLIVMSGPLEFSKQDETPVRDLSPDPNRHIVYIRFVPGFGSPAFGSGPSGAAGIGPFPDILIAPPQRIHGPMPGFGTILPGGSGRARGGGEALFPDDLERVLKPMGAQVLTVTTPESFRKIVASLIAEIPAN